MSYHQTGSLVDLADPQLAEDAVRDIADACGAYATAAARNLAPIGPIMDRRAPGTLKASYKQIDTHRIEQDDGNVGYASGVESDDYIARILEYGTREHEITPRYRGGALVFRAWPNGELVRVRRVHQRGLPAAHIVGRAVAATLLAFDEIAEPSVERWAKRQMAAAR